jgi:hypothetical protein
VCWEGYNTNFGVDPLLSMLILQPKVRKRKKVAMRLRRAPLTRRTLRSTLMVIRLSRMLPLPLLMVRRKVRRKRSLSVPLPRNLRSWAPAIREFQDFGDQQTW